MSARTIDVVADEQGMRLDRLLRRRFPDLKQAQIEKLMRTGQIRVDGRRAKSGHRVESGQTIRIPPLPSSASAAPRVSPPPALSADDTAFIRAMVIYEDDDVLALNKVSGLAVQGGTRTARHVDRLLAAFGQGAQKPRLVHRLDKETSGVLLVAKTAFAAAKLAEAFRTHTARKLYWGLVHGVPGQAFGTIDSLIDKTQLSRRHAPRAGEAKRAVTHYAMVANLAQQYAWLVLNPETGRTHQLRIHCAQMGHPLVGDNRYGNPAVLKQASGEIAAKLHLHAHSLRIPHPRGGILELAAPLTGHMKQTWQLLEFSPEDAREASQRLDDGSR